MKRASLLVTVKGGTCGSTTFTCESLHINFDLTVTFFASGRAYTVAQSDIEHVNYIPDSATWCPHCDQSINGITMIPFAPGCVPAAGGQTFVTSAGVCSETIASGSCFPGGLTFTVPARAHSCEPYEPCDVCKAKKLAP